MNEDKVSDDQLSILIDQHFLIAGSKAPESVRSVSRMYLELLGELQRYRSLNKNA